jgi:hypothetical protein
VRALRVVAGERVTGCGSWRGGGTARAPEHVVQEVAHGRHGLGRRLRLRGSEGAGGGRVRAPRTARPPRVVPKAVALL